MATRIITLCYRKIIDVTTAKPWEKLVFEDSYTEFKMQAQLFNQEKKYRTFAELKQFAPGADKLHFLVSAAVRGYLQQLNDTIPNIRNNLGQHFLKFKQFQFEIINSDITDKSKHQVAINFYSESLIWHDTIGNYLLVSDKNTTNEVAPMHLVAIQPYLTIYALRTEAE